MSLACESLMERLTSEIEELKQEIGKLSVSAPKCPDNPLDYAISKGWSLTDQQKDAMRACVTAPYSVLLKSAHSVGKTFTLACIASWFYDLHDDALVLCTAPVFQQVKDLLFKELRRLRPDDPNWLPRATRLQTSDRHAIIGFTANNPTSFQGRHSPHLCILFDEAAGIDLEFWERARSMAENNREGHLFVAAFNPYDISSPVYAEENSGRHTVLHLTALDHPNIIQRREVIPGAIAYQTIKDRVEVECRLLEDNEERAKAFSFDGKYWTTDNPLFEVQVLGKYPSRSINSVWSQNAIQLLEHEIKGDPKHLVQIGVDLAMFGDDRTCIAVRKGYNCIHMETHHGWTLKQTAERVKDLCSKHQIPGQKDTQIPVMYDSCGVGAGFVDHAGAGSRKFNFVPVNSAMKSVYEGEYPNIRSELWIETATLGTDGSIALGGTVPPDMRKELIQDLLSPVYAMDNLGRRVVEAKKVTKQRLKRSPDLADAFNLCFYQRPSAQYVEKVTGRI